MYVLEGTQEFIYDNKKYIVNEGDRIYSILSFPIVAEVFERKKPRSRL